MRVLVAHVYCDVCKNELGHTTDADESLSIRVLSNGKPKRLDVCTEHKDPTWSQISAYWLDDLDAGRPASHSANGKSSTVICPVCERSFKSTSEPGKSKHALMMHLTKLHSDLPIEERQRVAGFKVTRKNVDYLARKKTETSKASTPAKRTPRKRA